MTKKRHKRADKPSTSFVGEIRKVLRDAGLPADEAAQLAKTDMSMEQIISVIVRRSRRGKRKT